MLSIVNEYDMISRADPPYLHSLVDLYRSRNGLPPLSAPTTDHSPPVPSDESLQTKAWALPQPGYHLVGDIVVLRLKLMDAPAEHDDDTFSQASTLTSPVVNAVELSPEEFARLLFCDIGTHRRGSYLERMEMLVSRACESAVSLGGLGMVGTGLSADWKGGMRTAGGLQGGLDEKLSGLFAVKLEGLGK